MENSEVPPVYNEEELQLLGVHGDVAEFESPAGQKYRRVRSEDGAEQWFSVAGKYRANRARRAQVRICCKKLLYAFGIFVDRGSRVSPVCIFPRSSGLSSRQSAEINFCPWCGKKLEFLQSEETGKQDASRAVAAGNVR
jgi:hypothetical protein